MIQLKGITWDHSRGFTPLIACCQQYYDLHKTIEVHWYKRSLQFFADFSVDMLANDYDLLIIDHPSVGEAYHSDCLLPLDQYIESPLLDEQEKQSTGLSFRSYRYTGVQLALPIDAATPVSSYRSDLLMKHDEQPPQTWEQVIHMASKGRVAVPAIPIDILMNFYMFCLAMGEEPFSRSDEVVSDESGLKALQIMAELYHRLDAVMFSSNPITVANMMSTTDEYWYCPFSYGYSNYAKKSYANKPLTYSNPVTYKGQTLRSTLGGTGIAVSARSKHIEAAVEIACMLTSAPVQNGLYTDAGGQPGHLSAWQNKELNQTCHNYFLNTLPALQRAYMRPRYNGYLAFQHEAGLVLHQFFQGKQINEKEVISRLNALYRASLPKHPVKSFV